MRSEELELVMSIAWTDFKLRYSRSTLGFFWSLLKPLLMLTTLYIVFSLMINLQIDHYVLFLLLGIILWNFFTEATTSGLKSLAAKAGLIKKCVFNKRLIVISACITSLFSLLLNLAVFAVFIIIFRVPLRIHSLMLPAFIILLFILSLGISYALSVLYLRFKDMDHIWDVLLQVGFWITPIVYSLSIIPSRYVKWYTLNPLARIINDSRDAVLFHSLPSFKHIAITVIGCIIIYIIGRLIFDKNSRKLGELA
jgi:lipopolysaccharide transport system permease protein